MVKCKKCGEVIERLCSYATATCNCSLDAEGNLVYEEEDMGRIAETIEWRCPECDEVLAWNEDEAVSYLKDGLTAKERKLPFPNQYERIQHG